jgi:hypothetical protein
VLSLSHTGTKSRSKKEISQDKEVEMKFFQSLNEIENLLGP